MDEILYNALGNYYHTLEYTGYMPYQQLQKLLVLSFYKNYVLEDYRGVLSKEDYNLIEKALDCMYGSTCLIPYPDYLKMGRLILGGMTELATRVKTLENKEVVQVIHDLETTLNKDSESDIFVIAEEEEE